MEERSDLRIGLDFEIRLSREEATALKDRLTSVIMEFTEEKDTRMGEFKATITKADARKNR